MKKMNIFTLLYTDVSMYFAPMRLAKSHASDTEIGFSPETLKSLNCKLFVTFSLKIEN